VPLADSTADAAVFCLALMSTDYPEALRESARVLKPGGTLWVAEVRSRFAGGRGRGSLDGGDDEESESDDGGDGGRFRRWQPRKKTLGKGGGKGSASLISNRQQQRNEQHQPRSQSQPPKEDVGPFVRAVCSLGFEHATTDGSNRMFVVMTFRRKNEEGEKKNGQKRKQQKRRREEDDDSDGEDRGRLVGGRGGWPSLRPCSYKKR
jgi:ribosomal RNA-processing protein 8